jgi:TonB family protein
MARRYAALGAVAAIHLAVLWMLAAAMHFQAAFPAQNPQELQINLLSPNLGGNGTPAPPLDWTFLDPEQVLVPEPQFTIESDLEAANAIAAVGITRKLAPRLDPRHVNAMPELPHTLGSYVMALSLELRVLILPDGSVGDAQIVRSTGQGEIDQIAIETIKDSWRYLPASINGKPIEAWTTIMVRFTSF